MKNSKNVLLFFISVLILVWNPLTFYLCYSNHEVYDSKILKLIFWLIPFVGILVFLYVKRQQSVSQKLESLIFNGSYMGIILGFLILINFLIGVFTKSDNSDSNRVVKNEGLIFKPNSAAVYSTVEFNYKAEINNLGLRNKEIKIEKDSDTFRILCFGDSWTFGWGVDIEFSWPMQMENYFKEHGYTNIEVINCGQGGQFTATYRQYMAEAVPLLKPDLVLVGVLQLDDLAQIFENRLLTESKGNMNSPKYLLRSFLMASFGNYLKLVGPKDDSVVDIKAVWEDNNNDLINDFKGLRQLRFTTLTDTVQTLFKTGNLNPGLLNNYIDFPDRVTIFNNPKHPATRDAMEIMSNDFEKMSAICKSNGATLIFINLPMNYFTGHAVERMPSDILNDYFMENNSIDSIYSSIARINQIPYLQLTQHFKDLVEKDKYFFSYDGHPNKEGYQQIATEIAKHLIETQYVTK
jgi:lysophospholipase L1-like esterase